MVQSHQVFGVTDGVCGYNNNMTELSKFINLMIEFEEKIEGHLNKKYKSFLRSVINLDALAKNTKPDRVLVTRELMVFKLGLEAKSAKAVEISLAYLLKCFNMKFIEVGMPNPCENYVIEQSGVREQLVGEAKTEVRHLVIDLIKKNLIYKNTEIHQLILKILENLISEPILPILLDIAVQYPQEAANQVLYNYFSFRFYVYQEICFYSEKELQSFATINKNQRSEKEIKAALKEDEVLGDLISKYMNEYLSIIDKDGGRYGNCVMCAQPADHYCRITKASLCGLDCKKKHIEMAEHQYKHYFQAVNLWETIETSFQELLIFLQTHESPLVFAVFTKLLDKPHLFMVTKQNFRTLLAKHVPLIMLRVLNYKNESAFENIYQFAASITKNWLYECLSTVEHFFRDYILKVLDEKKPLVRFLNMICKALARIFEQGKVTVQLFINFDCEVNRLNIIEKVLFQMSRILQDRFGHGSHLSKQERISVKNNFLSLAIIIAMGLNEYRKQQPKQIDTLEISTLKQKKISLQQFVLKFNEGWTSGLKTLFNLNLVGLDSNEQIVDILMNMKGINKERIDELFFCEKGIELFQIFSKKICQKHHRDILMALLELHHYIPLKISSIGIKKFLQRYKFYCEVEQIESQATNWMDFLTKNYTRQQFTAQMVRKRPDLSAGHSIQKIYVFAVQTKQGFTVGNHKTYFTYCCSRSYLDVIASQIALLQIPLSFMLETDYQIERILALVEELVQICAHSNWISLLTKSSSIAKYPTAEFDEVKLKIVLGVLEIIEKHAYFIQDWSTIINFLAKLYRIVLKVRAQSDSKVILQNQVPIARIERCLMEASAKSEPHFSKLLLAMLVVGRQELQRDNLFMIQKFFEAIDRNLKTFLSIAQQFLPYLSNFVKNLNESSIEAAITIADMLKQTFAKLLKLPKTGNSWADNCQAQFWKLFQTLGNHKSNEVNDFVINCVSMSVLHHYDLSYKSWIVLFSFMKRRVLEYRAQFYTILQKIINCKLKGCEQFGHDLVIISLNILHPIETKISIQSLHLLKNAMEIISDIKMNGALSSDKEQNMESARLQIKQVLKQILLKLIECLYFECHEYIIEHFFRLVKFKVNGDFLLNHEQIHQMMNVLFKKVESFDKNTLQVAEKTLSYGLNWSVANKYSQIVQHLQKLVVDKYNSLSFSAVRCLKTYIQIINPKTQVQWEPIQTTFLSILQNTHLSHLVDLNMPNLYEDSAVPMELRDGQLRLDVGLFANKLTIQKYITDILPNHERCIEEMIQLHKEVIQFNDNLYLRILLWRRGLGISDTEHPPNLLTLEESLASKIIATYQNLSKPNELFNFAYQNFKRYCSFSQLLIKTNQAWAATGMHEGRQNQNWGLYTDYLRLRKTPLFRILNYFLPKLKRFCIERDQKKSMILILVESCKYIEQRDGVLKAIKELTHKQN